MSEYCICIPNWKPTSLNSYSNKHWSVRKKAKDGDTQMIAYYAFLINLPKATTKRRLQMDISVSGRGRLPDPDNLLKSTLDALKRTGYLIDDSYKWCEWFQPIIKRAKETSTKIIITDIHELPPAFAMGIHPQLTAKRRGKSGQSTGMI